jgi:phosphoglycolate phosphatase
MRTKLIVFDFDGTLVDTKEDIANAVNYALSRVKLPSVDSDTIWRYTGDGTPLLVERVLKDKNRLDLYDEVLKETIKYYEAHSADFAKIMDGVEETLKKLLNKKLAILSNKYESFIKKILKEYDIEKYFFAVYGKDSFEKSKPDPYPLFKIMEQAGVQRDETVYVGDSKNDVLVGKNAGIKVFIIPSGVTPLSELRKLKPYKILTNIRELANYIE